MKPYAQLTGNAWFFVPTCGYIRHADGERMLSVIWLNLEIGVRWYG